MSSKKDMRRRDLAVPYAEPESTKSELPDMTGTLSSTLPMAAIFTKSRLLGWVAVVMAIQSWLGESPESRKTAATPAIFTVGMSVMGLLVAYMQVVLPQTGSSLKPGPATLSTNPLST